MPINQQQTALEARIEKLRWCAVALKGNQGFKEAIKSDALFSACEHTADLFALLQILISERAPEVPGLNKYLAEVIKIAEDIHKISAGEQKKFAKPNIYMQRLIMAFEAFSSRVATERSRNRLRNAVSFIPVVEGVVAACGGIPYYFEHANTSEKVGMILCAALLITALALTIAVYTSPAIAGIPLLWPAITACVLLSRILYDQASFNAKKKFEEKPKVFAATDKINSLKEEMQAYQKQNFPEQVEAGRLAMHRAANTLNEFARETASTFNSGLLWERGARRRKKNANLFRVTDNSGMRRRPS